MERGLSVIGHLTSAKERIGMRKKEKEISAEEKRKGPKRVIRKLRVTIWVGSLLGKDQVMVRESIPKSWKIVSMDVHPVSREVQLDYEVLITE
jgi:hypothetical protein